MRIVIDLQGAQSESRFRGIGRYSLALALGVARNAGPHEIWLVLNGALGAAIAEIRHAFDGLIPQERIRVFDIVTPVAEASDANATRSRAAELIREYFIAALQPDAILVTSLFEGYVDNAVTSVGAFAGGDKTAVILYDLIPFLNPATYLATATQQHYYERKISSLRQAALLLSISDYSKQEAIEALALEPSRVVAISTAVEDNFQPGQLSDETRLALCRQFGITRNILMYAPGGFDARKNIDGLIAAYALLPAALRSEHQLVIASRFGTNEYKKVIEQREHCGLASDDLILTGYVDDATLIALYRATTLFIFPSKHEGFGLPALEAMACGALVIGADNTSIPEVIGCAEAMFDAHSPQSIADKIAQVLTDTALRTRLRSHGSTQAAKFSWDISAQRALRALEERFAPATLCAAPPAPAASTPTVKRRLAFVTPLPPERTGIADHAAQLLPAMAEHFDIELIVQQAVVTLAPELAALPQRSVAWFSKHADRYDQILYQFGNSPFHSHMFALLQEHPGVVVLHDFFLSGVLAYDQMTAACPGAWSMALYHSHGYRALQASQVQDDFDQTKDSYPCNLAVLEAATHVIVHSGHAQELARSWYGAGAADNWSIVPLPRATPKQLDRAAARQALGIRPDAFLVCSFGFIGPSKLIDELLQAWLASCLHADDQCELVLVGANHGGDYGAQISATIRAAGAKNRIRIAGWTDEAVYHQYLQAADAGVQLRTNSRGETSAAVLDCMNYGLPTIVNANGSMAELPDDTVWKLPDSFTLAALTDALETIKNDATRRATLGAKAQQLLATRHSPQQCAQDYAAALELAHTNAACDRHALIRALTSLDLPHDQQSLKELGLCLASTPDPLAQRQLLVDVTAIAQHDLKTGIERVVRTQLLELLQHPLPGFRVEPVYLSQQDGQWHYRYAHDYACRLLGINGRAAFDAVVDIGPRDQFYCADYSPDTVVTAARGALYANWRARGLQVNFLVHDLLPVLRPEFFPANADQAHGAWLDAIAQNADRLICISQAVADEMQAWMETRAQHANCPAIKVLHHGNDLAVPAVTSAKSQPLALLPELAASPSFLMVGTIEPRKGHLQTLDAFEQLWKTGQEVKLVIVGKAGWTPLAQHERRTIPTIEKRLRNHKELGKRLLWLQGISDAQLEQLYRNCTCLIFASEGEGFGLPLIEAAQYGLPIIARDLPVFREVARQHAYYFSGLEGRDLADAIQAWLVLHASGSAPASGSMPHRSWAQNVAQLCGLLGLTDLPLNSVVPAASGGNLVSSGYQLQLNATGFPPETAGMTCSGKHPPHTRP